MGTDAITDETLLNDITNTEIEYQAYIKIYQGFLDLSRLPENAGYIADKYYRQHQEYLRLSNECHLFLVRLQQIKKERGL